jgi:hypothetical protein
MCHLFFTTESPRIQAIVMHAFFADALESIESPDLLDGIGVVMKQWSIERREPIWIRFREVAKKLSRRTEDNIEREIRRANSSAFGAHVRVFIANSNDNFPYPNEEDETENVNYKNVNALQPILFKDDYSMLFKGRVVRFPDPDIQRKIRDRILLHTHKLFANDLNVFSDVSYVFFLILAFIYEDYLSNTPPDVVAYNEEKRIKVPPSEERAMRGITNAIAWFGEVGIELVAHIVLLTPHFAAVAVHNAPEWFVNKDEPVTTFSTNGFYRDAQRREGDAMFVIPINDAELDRRETPPAPYTHVDAIASIPRNGHANARSQSSKIPGRPPR